MIFEIEILMRKMGQKNWYLKIKIENVTHIILLNNDVWATKLRVSTAHREGILLLEFHYIRPHRSICTGSIARGNIKRYLGMMLNNVLKTHKMVLGLQKIFYGELKLVFTLPKCFFTPKAATKSGSQISKIHFFFTFPRFSQDWCVVWS